MIYLLSIKIGPNKYELRGMYESEDDARATVLPGDFLINRYPVGTAFSSSLVDAGQTGAVFFSKISNDETVQDLATRLEIVEGKIAEANQRVTVLEGDA